MTKKATPKPYTQEELDFLLANHETMTADQLGAALGRNPSSIPKILWDHFRVHAKRKQSQPRSRLVSIKNLEDYQKDKL